MDLNKLLDAIAREIPERAELAKEIRAREDSAFKTRAAQRLFRIVLGTTDLSMTNRVLIETHLSSHAGGKKASTLPAVRCTDEEYNKIATEAETRNMTIADLIREKLFSE